MKYLFLLLSIFFLQSALTAQTPKPDFQIDQFHPKWGAKNIESPTDIQASAKVYSDGEKIHIEVEVVDDMLVNNADVLHTDHVEVWFGLPFYDLVEFPPYYEIGEKKKFIDSNLPRKDYCFESRRRNDNYLPPPKIHIYDKIEDPCFEYPKNITCGNCSKFAHINDFTGITHFGLFLGNQTAYLYDHENYFLFEQATNYKIGNLAEGIKYETKLNAKGYRVIASFSPKALGFVALPTMSTLQLMIDVIDVDKTGKQETLISSSSIRKWGNIAHFNTVNFQQPINTNRTSIPSSIWIPKDVYSASRGTPLFLVYTDMGWKKYNFTIGLAQCVEVDDMGCISNQYTYNLFPSFLHHQQKRIGKYKLNIVEFNTHGAFPIESYSDITRIHSGTHLIHQLNDDFLFSYQNYISEKDKRTRFSEYWWGVGQFYIAIEDLEKEFAFHNYTLGVITTDISGGHTGGTCGGCVSFILVVNRYLEGKFEEVIKIENDFCCLNSIKINDNRYKEVDIEKFVWTKLGKELKIITRDRSKHLNSKELECYPSSIYITFNDDGTLQEIYPLPEKE